ncbi:MAG TPA: hypothetical protein VMW80_00820 [Candidatus Dormibacteraeota bacterium]|nr:hypothetical protein [Candidatus Dormibacteraeota bacterium]
METTIPAIRRIRNGWLALGDGWAVRADTEAEAIHAYESRTRWHAEVDARPPRVAYDEEESGK